MYRIIAPKISIFIAILSVLVTASTAVADVPEFGEESQDQSEEAPSEADWGASEPDMEIETEPETQTSRTRTASEYQPPAGPQRPERIAAITAAPIYLVIPMLRITGEYRIVDNFGGALLLGYGSVSPESEMRDDDLEGNFSMLHIGAQGNFYPTREFGGVHVGGQLLTQQVRYEDDLVSGTATSIGLTGYIGYKAVANVGFTFVGQIGYGYYMTAAEAEGAGHVETASDEGGALHLKLNLGWSF